MAIVRAEVSGDVSFDVIIGTMGSGKTTFVNKLAATTFPVCPDSSSCTTASQFGVVRGAFRDDGSQVVLVDTEGIGSNAKHKKGDVVAGVIDALEAVNGKVVCRFIHIIKGTERAVIDPERSVVEQVAEITGVPVAEVTQTYGAARPQMQMAHVGRPLVREFETWQDADRKLPSKCMLVRLPEGWKDSVRRHDIGTVKRQLEEARESHCHDVVSLQKEQVASVAKQRGLVAGLAEKRFGYPRPPAECPRPCVKWDCHDFFGLCFNKFCIQKGEPDKLCVTSRERIHARNVAEHNKQVTGHKTVVTEAEAALEKLRSELNQTTVLTKRCDSILFGKPNRRAGL